MGYPEREYTVFYMSNIHKTEYKEIIEHLVKARLDAGYTQKQVASKLGKSQSYISKIENCERRLDILEAKILCRAYGIGVGKIV